MHIHILFKYYYYRFEQSTFISVYRHKCLFLLFILSVSLRSHLGSFTFLLQNGFYISCPILKVKVTQSCLTLCDSMDCIVHGILQARILEWVAFPFSRGSSQPRDLPRSPTLLVDYLPAEPQGIEKKLQSTFQSQSCTQKTSWSLFGCLLLV